MEVGSSRLGDCEICGSGGSRIRRVNYVGSTVGACEKCLQRLNLNPQPRTQMRSDSTPKQSSKGYRGGGRSGKDIMLRGAKELRRDYAKVITASRESRGWTKIELAAAIGVRLNIIQRVESGNQPDDDLVKRLEKSLGISLMKEVNPDGDGLISRRSSSGMTLGDFFDE